MSYRSKDLLANFQGFALGWGVPIAGLVGAIFIANPAKTIIWLLALLWMGLTCLANARRCGRTHCYFTGPFFILMAILASLHGFEILFLGADGWRWLGMAVGVGGGFLWCFSEFLWGKYFRRDMTEQGS